MSRAVASRASAQTGIDADVLKRLLPIAATLVMGSLVKQQFSQQANRAPSAADAGGDIFSRLTPMLDQNRDGSVVDDIMKNVGRFMR
jgi:hypothetical protein